MQNFIQIANAFYQNLVYNIQYDYACLLGAQTLRWEITMSQVFAAIIGGKVDADDTFAFQRPILFEDTGELMQSYVPCQVEKTFFIRTQEETDIAGTQTLPLQTSRYAALAEIPECEHVIVFDAPFVSSFDVVERLIVQNARTGYDMTVMGTGETSLEADGCYRCKTPLVAVMSYALVKKLPLEKCNSLSEVTKCAKDMLSIVGYLNSESAMPIDSGISCYRAQKVLSVLINESFIAQGVQFFDIETTYVSYDAKISAGATIMPQCQIRKGCTIGAGAYVGAGSILEGAEIGDHVTINQSQIYESRIGNGTTVGPFAYVRPGCEVGEKCRIGDFVEMKKANIGNGTKVSHLTYIGDATVGERVNFGCGTVVVNYDGYHKYQTTIGDDCFIGCNTNLVAPVSLGDRAFTAAGTTVTKDVPDGALAVARARQTTLEGWNDKRRARLEK